VVAAAGDCAGAGIEPSASSASLHHSIAEEVLLASLIVVVHRAQGRRRVESLLIPKQPEIGTARSKASQSVAWRERSPAPCERHTRSAMSQLIRCRSVSVATDASAAPRERTERLGSLGRCALGRAMLDGAARGQHKTMRGRRIKHTPTSMHRQWTDLELTCCRGRGQDDCNRGPRARHEQHILMIPESVTWCVFLTITVPL
jgi:hypothetical protein